MSRNGWLIIVAAMLVGSGGCQKGRAELESQPQPQDRSPTTSKTEKVRQPAVAGLFYPGDKKELAATVDKFLANAKLVPIKKLRGLVCPHAGYEYSGQTAAFAYKQLEGRDVKTVIIMAPSHYARFQGASIPEVDAYATPLGAVSLSPRASQLANSPPFVRNPPCEVGRPGWWRRAPKEVPPFGEDTPHTWEHSLEVQLPFLQRTLKDFSIVPIVFGQVDAEEAAQALAGSIDEKTILVASSDLSHYHPYDVAVQLDSSCTRAICDLDVRWMEDEEACGKLPILTLMHIARKKGWKAKLLDYRNSGDVTGDKSGVVGYAAIAFFEPDGQQPSPETSATESAANLTPQEREFLVQLADKTVQEVVRHGRLPQIDPAEVSENLEQRRACFVTLTKGGKLRGCIGSIFPSEPLWQAVIHKARSAALEDPRFPPVEPGELGQLEIEVSVLTMPKRLEFKSPQDLLAKLRPHVDGVVLRAQRRQATYLPQVWEQLPQPEEFLSHLSQKAGLPPFAWKSPEALVLVYQVQAFKQSEM